MTLQKGLFLLVIATSATVSGCMYRTSRSVNDTLWEKNELKLIRHTENSIVSLMAACSSERVLSQKWELATIPYPNQPFRFTKKRTLLNAKGDSHHSFRSIHDSDLLIHATAARFTLFNPKTGKDVSSPFPSKPAERYWFNRSRTACLFLEGNQAVIVDTLSAKSGEPKVLSRPPWGKELQQLISGRYNNYSRYHPIILTEDISRLVLVPNYGNSGGVWPPNFTGEIWLTNKSERQTNANFAVEKFTVPTELREGGIVDAELIDDEVFLIWRDYLSKKGIDGVKLLNSRGEISGSITISPHTHGGLWDIKQNQMLFPYWTGSGWDGELWQTYYLWNHQSNSVQKISL